MDDRICIYVKFDFDFNNYKYDWSIIKILKLRQTYSKHSKILSQS